MPLAPSRPPAFRVGALDVVADRRADGTTYLRSPHPLGPYPPRATERLAHWAARAPARPFLARRGADGEWRALTYGDALARARRIAHALLARGLCAGRPVAILSGNSPEHALLALAAMHVGVPVAPLAPEWSLLSRDHVALRHALGVLRPGLVLADDAAAHAPALRHALAHGAEVVTVAPPPRGLRATPFGALEEEPSPAALHAVAAAHAAVRPDTVAKVLFTSGSTGAAKGVITTHGMLGANQAMLATVLAGLADAPPVLCDWLPWHHTFGGSHNLGLVLHHGGTLYLDDGRPTPDGIAATVRNLREVACTARFDVPRGFELLLPHLRADAALRERFFSRLGLLFHAAAGLDPRVRDALQALGVAERGARVPFLTGFGATESAPFALCAGDADAAAGAIGVPAPGVEVKLAPVGDRLELRLRGPNVTPGYWRDDARTRAAFDEEGYCRLGDAVRLVDAADARRGLRFEGRLGDDFKLSTGTRVQAGALRDRLLAALGPHARDVVLAGRDRPFVAALVFPDVEACRALVPGGASFAVPELLARREVRDAFARLLARAAGGELGSSRRVARAVLADEPPSLDAGELTSKRTVVPAVVLRTRAALVEELYAEPPSPRVLVIDEA